MALLGTGLDALTKNFMGAYTTMQEGQLRQQQQARAAQMQQFQMQEAMRQQQAQEKIYGLMQSGASPEELQAAFAQYNPQLAASMMDKQAARELTQTTLADKQLQQRELQAERIQNQREMQAERLQQQQYLKELALSNRGGGGGRSAKTRTIKDKAGNIITVDAETGEELSRIETAKNPMEQRLMEEQAGKMKDFDDATAAGQKMYGNKKAYDEIYNALVDKYGKTIANQELKRRGWKIK